MKHIKIRFEQDSLLPHIEVVVRASEQDSQVSELMQMLSSQDSKLLMITDIHNITHAVPMNDIILLSVSRKQTKVITADDNYTIPCSLQNIERNLDPQSFVRISRHEIVNLLKVRHYDFSLSGTLRLQLVNGQETWASRRSIPVIRKRISGKE